ncbi:MAG: hypothetical protein F3739_07250 [Nitrospinae bacterium]|nr:hypothetical protein [Nitrospinota bacterium]
MAPFELKLGPNESYGLSASVKPPPGAKKAQIRAKIIVKLQGSAARAQPLKFPYGDARFGIDIEIESTSTFAWTCGVEISIEIGSNSSLHRNRHRNRNRTSISEFEIES